MAHLPITTPWITGLVVLVAVAAGPACSGGGGGSGGSPNDPYGSEPGELQPGLNEVVLRGQRFDPRVRRIAPGTTITWRNTANESHTVTPDGHAEFARQPTSAAGVVFSHRFDRAGTFGYYCEIHGAPGAGMFGQIVVE